MPLCSRCGQKPACPRSVKYAGLCGRCVFNFTHAEHVERQKGQPRPIEPTQEELDALVAQQMKNLPAWWNKEQPKGEPDPLPPLLRRLAEVRRMRRCRA